MDNTPQTKYCTGCQAHHPVDEFPWKSQARGIRHSRCKRQQAKNSKKHYQAHKGEYIDRAKERYSFNRAVNTPELEAYLRQTGCKDCGEKDAACLRVIAPGGAVINSQLLVLNWETAYERARGATIYCANCAQKHGISL